MPDSGFPDIYVQTRSIATNTNIPDDSYAEIKGGYLRIESGILLRIGKGSFLRVTK